MTTAPLLSKQDMERIAQAKDVSLRYATRKRGLEIHGYHQGVVHYLGMQHALEKLSEEAFAAKVADRLAKAESATGDKVRRVAEVMGYVIHVIRNGDRAGMVQIWPSDNSCMRKLLGNIDVLVEMSEVDLRRIIAAKFAK